MIFHVMTIILRFCEQIIVNIIILSKKSKGAFYHLWEKRFLSCTELGI